MPLASHLWETEMHSQRRLYPDPSGFSMIWEDWSKQALCWVSLSWIQDRLNF